MLCDSVYADALKNIMSEIDAQTAKLALEKTSYSLIMNDQNFYTVYSPLFNSILMNKIDVQEKVDTLRKTAQPVIDKLMNQRN
jgi:SMC interacting uncharacterized protein involved in chromosome segregation